MLLKTYIVYEETQYFNSAMNTLDYDSKEIGRVYAKSQEVAEKVAYTEYVSNRGVRKIRVSELPRGY